MPGRPYLGFVAKEASAGITAWATGWMYNPFRNSPFPENLDYYQDLAPTFADTADNSLARFDKTLGKIQECGIVVDDDDNMTVPGWILGGIASGDTASRPAAPETGTPYLDTDLGYVIWAYGGVWINASGAAV